MSGNGIILDTIKQKSIKGWYVVIKALNIPMKERIKVGFDTCRSPFGAENNKPSVGEP